MTEDAAISTSETRVRGFPYRKPAVVAAHAVLFALGLFAAFLNAYDFRWTLVDRAGVSYQWYLDLYLPLLALALPSKLLIFYWARQYRSSWRYVGLRDLFNVISASLVASFAFLSVYFLLENGWEQAWGRPLIDDGPVVHLRQSSVFLLDWAATIGFVCAARVLFRFYYEARHPGRSERSTRVLVVGAGDTGEAVVRQLFRTRREHYECVGFLDDNDANLHGRIHDIEILGRTSQIREICLSHRVEEVLIALPDAGPKTIRRLVERCNATGVRFRTIPDVADVIEGRVQVRHLRDVDITDLLGREPVELDTEKIGGQLRGQCVLVTGAGGSIGSEMCRQIAAFGPRRLVLLEQAENTLFEIERELRAKHAELSIGAYVGDIVDHKRVCTVLDAERPSVVFHAAAHKHVPLMESNAGEAIKNNIGGTASLADACAAAGVERMVLISTDKAINPTSIMGCSKRIAELYVQSCNARTSTQFVTVRFGNVLGSSGSVVPIFREQIANGGPVTVTHEDMTRFFMTIPEAAQLVLQAGAMGKGGEIYILHMGKPVRILDLARDMISLSGLRPGIDIDIVFTGTRPGEKLFEELSGAGEDIGDTAHPKIGIWKPRSSNWDSIRGDVERLLKVADTYSKEQLQAQLQRMVPEYGPDRSSRNPANGVVAEAP